MTRPIGYVEVVATAAVGPSLISQLQNERNFMGVDQLGMNGAIELPVTSYEQGREATDQAIASLQDFVDSRGDELGGAFDAGLAAVGAQLSQLRANIDASTLRNTNQPFADEIAATSSAC